MVMMLLFGLSFFSVGAHPDTNKYRIQNVVIYGESNLTSFWLRYSDVASANIKMSHNHVALETDSFFNSFEFAVDEFKGSNRHVVTDFEQMLRSDINPNIYIQFNKEFCYQFSKKDKPQFFDIVIQIGGIERIISSECIAVNRSGPAHLFKGKAIIHLSDYQLVPPSHFFGIIKVKDTIMITFEVLVLSK